MICHWEEYDLGPTQARTERIHATINRKNTILINGNLHTRLGNPEAVKLLFDRVNSVIGIVAVPATMANSFPVTVPAAGRHRLIRATPFCRHFGISIDCTTYFRDPEIDEKGILRLNLKNTAMVRRRPLSRKRHSPTTAG
ncbi:MAG: hypothetical protein IPO41_17480 [Acidobacteria bacterium]|nr:hypothetical protein [Acidobacteriota bacterium]